jgi:phosphoenolpyruvate-protein kinase (PTS system EI component)
VRVLLPLARSAEDVARVRALAPEGLPVGAMIETPEAVDAADGIAKIADFLSIGTNDLTALALRAGRADVLRALDPRVLELVRRTVEAAHRRGRTVTVCGELAGTAEGARVLADLGVDALSVAPGRLGAVRRVLASARERPR